VSRTIHIGIFFEDTTFLFFCDILEFFGVILYKGEVREGKKGRRKTPFLSGDKIQD
jgi:hypothetical protein